MVQPFDYTLKTPSTTESFLAGVQAYQNQQKVNAAQAAAEASARADQAKIDEANNFSRRAKEVAKDPSPKNLSDLYADFPTFSAGINAFKASLSDAKKTTYGSILQNAIIAKDLGKTPEEIAAIYTEGAEAARNSNSPDIAEKFDFAAQLARSPNADDNFAAKSLLNAIDPDAYKVAYERSNITVIPGKGYVLNSEIDAAVAAARKAGSPNAEIPIAIPEKAVSMLKSGAVTPAAFDSIFGPGAANKTLNAGGQTATPSGNFQGQ
jgi:propanediol dehydratase small subunit